MVRKLQGEGDVEGPGSILQHVKTYIFHNGHKSISHNIIQDRLLPTIHARKKMDPHKIQRLVTNVM
jgi:hypothetical protein